MDNIYCVYILWSIKWGRYYTGMSNKIERRLLHHNQGKNQSTKNGTPWKLVWNSVPMEKKQAADLEKKIKKRGAKRYLIKLKDK